MTDPLDSLICLRPFFSLELNVKGNVSVCCPAWTKSIVGNLKKKSLAEIWNDEPLQEMRRALLEGRWDKVCRANCPTVMKYRMSGRLTPMEHQSRELITDEMLAAIRSRTTTLPTGPTWVNMANSSNCNLNCIMCGREHYRDDRELLDKAMRDLKSLLPGVRQLFLTGNGDPFARSDSRQFLLELDPTLHPNLRINLLTNGLLLPRYWDRVRHLNYGFIDISIDAATKETYERIRVGGKWEELLRALQVVRENRARFGYAGINMTVMRDNFREIPAFVQLAADYGFGVSINRIRGKWGDQNFFTGRDAALLKELREVILQATQVATDSNVLFNSSSFCDILAGTKQNWRQRYAQIATDSAASLYYKLKQLQR